MKNFEKKYQLWTYADMAFTFTEFDTLQECIEAPKYSDWYVTKRVQLSVTDNDDIQNPRIGLLPTIEDNHKVYVPDPIPREIRSDEEENSALVAAYSRGPIGNLGQS